MSKALHSRHNKIFLGKLRKLRESRQLRQADLCKLLGRSQGHGVTIAKLNAPLALPNRERSKKAR